MAQQQKIVLEGKEATIVHGEYGVSVIMNERERHDPTPEERERARQQDQIARSTLLRELDVTPEVFEALKKFALPQPIRPAISDFGKVHESVYSRQQIRKWQAEIRAVVSRLGTVK
jgi:hypothetical protein